MRKLIIRKEEVFDIEIEPENCNHDWEHCLTPPDSGHKWYRCSICGAFGHPKRPSSWNFRQSGSRLIIIPYRCSLKGCSKPAVERLTGRGPRLSYIWRCKGHKDD